MGFILLTTERFVFSLSYVFLSAFSMQTKNLIIYLRQDEFEVFVGYSVQFSSVTQSFPTLCDPMNRSMSGVIVYHQLPESTQTHVHWVGDAIQPSHPLSSPSPPTFNLSQHQGLFKWVSSSIRWPKYWSFSFSLSPSNEHPGLISFRMDWLDLLAVQGTLKSLLQLFRWQ